METLFAGFPYVRRQPVLLGAMSIDLFAMMLGSVTALLPIFARDILRVGPWGLGLLRSAPALGAAVVAVWLAYRPVTRRGGAGEVPDRAPFGGAAVAVRRSPNFPLTLAAPGGVVPSGKV